MNHRHFPLYLSQPHPCAYLPGRSSRIMFLDPDAPVDMTLYGRLIEQGFRRSGDNIYRPACSCCDACIPVRIPVVDFKPRRSQRRAWRRIDDLVVRSRPARFDAAHFRLYRRYIDTRHPDGAMAAPSESAYLRFLTCDWADTRFLEFRAADKLLAVAVTDLLPTALSAVYTFFDPDLQREYSPGVLAILWQLDVARRRGLPWLYLGFWVPGCAKMDYKTRYQPLQGYLQGQWQEFNPGEPLLRADQSIIKNLP